MQDPKTRCEALGFCTSSSNHESSVGHKVDDLKNSEKCIICEFVMRELDNMLQQNATQVKRVVLFYSELKHFSL